MGTRNKDFEARLNVVALFTGTGIVGGPSYRRRGETWLRLVTEGVDTTNSVKVQGRLFGQTAWVDVGSPVVGLGAGATIDIKDYDEFRFNCTVYAASGTPKLIVSGFHN